jgi:hypothetical protein
MEIQEIEVTIDEYGRVRIEVHGVQGKKCLDLTQNLEAALGGEVDERELKPEAYDATVQEEVRDEQRLGDA